MDKKLFFERFARVIPADVVIMAPLALTLIAGLDTDSQALVALIALIALTTWTFLLRAGLVNPMMDRSGGAVPEEAGPNAGDIRNSVVSSAVTALTCAAMFLPVWYAQPDLPLWQGVLIAAAGAVMGTTWTSLAANGTSKQLGQWIALFGKVLNALGVESSVIGPECAARLLGAADE